MTLFGATRRRRKVLVVGTFRSGTNLMKHVLESHYRAKVVFSEWFWKHGLPPTMARCPIPIDVPIVVMTRDPVTLNASLYDFWKKWRPELDIGSDLSDFIKRPLIVYDNTGGLVHPQYLFPSPTGYWNQFHFAWSHWPAIDDRRTFVQLERFQADPMGTVSTIAERIGLRPMNTRPIRLPEQAVRPSQDGKTAELGGTQSHGRTILSDADVALVVRQTDPQIAQHLGYSAR